MCPKSIKYTDITREATRTKDYIELIIKAKSREEGISMDADVAIHCTVLGDALLDMELLFYLLTIFCLLAVRMC